MMALNLSKFWPKIILSFCLVAILNLAIVVPIAQAVVFCCAPTVANTAATAVNTGATAASAATTAANTAATVGNTTKKNTFDFTWKGIKTAWHKIDAFNWFKTALNLAWQKRYQILKVAANYAAQIALTVLLNMMTNDIVNWIKYGTTPRFITEGPWAYLKTAANNALGYFIDQYLGAGYLCEPFALDLKIMYSSGPSTFQERARCNLSDMGRNLKSFTNDFRSGGWKTWINLVGHNEYDAYFTTQEAWNNLFNKVNENNKTDYQLGNGFLSMKSCRWTDDTGKIIQKWSPMLGRGVPKTPKDCKSTSDARKHGKVIGICHYQCRTETPSSVVSSMANKVINEPIDRVSRAISNLMGNNPFKIYLVAIANAIIWRAMHEAGGLLFGDSSFSYDKIASSTQNINVPLPKSHSIREEAENASSTIAALSSLGGIIEKYRGDVRTNQNLEKGIQIKYNQMASEAYYVTSTEEQIIDSGCNVRLPSYPDSVYIHYPAWLENISSWQTWNRKRISDASTTIENIDNALSLITSSTRAIKKFVTSEKSYEDACANSKESLCDHDPQVKGLKKFAQDDLKTAINSVNKVLSLLGETSVNSLSEASASLTNAATNVANLDLDEQNDTGSGIANNSLAHPQPDGSWSGTLYDQLNGDDITAKKAELDKLYSRIQKLAQQCNL